MLPRFQTDPSRVYINPLPGYDQDGSIIAPKDYDEKFSDTEFIVEAEFSLHHFVLQGGNGGRCFIACPHSLLLVNPADVTRGQHSTRPTNSQTKREIKDEPGVKQEE